MMIEDAVRCRIHRGCHEIGGNCVEIEARGKRIVLDVGLPLADEPDVTVPGVSGFASLDENLLGVVISHPHPDHYGLIDKVANRVSVHIGEAARRIIEVSAFFTPLPSLGDIELSHYHDQQPISLGPFTITPFLIDHSAFDSHCFLIEVGGKRIFYSGDIRAHGRKSYLFDSLIADPPPNIDLLICEGTQVGRPPDFAFPNENSVTDEMVSTLQMRRAWGLSGAQARILTELYRCMKQHAERIAN